MIDFVAVVPARAGSKGVVAKNTRDLAGVALWRRAVQQGQVAGAKKVIVTTDIPEILAEPETSVFQAIARPDELAGDATPMAPVLLHALADDALRGEVIVLLQPTSPMRDVSDIHAALAIYAKGDADLVMSVTEADRGTLKYGTLDGDRFVPMREAAHCFTNRQALPPVVKPNGAVYVFGRDWFLANEGFVTERIAAVSMPSARSFDIDTEDDFARAEALLSGSGGG